MLLQTTISSPPPLQMHGQLYLSHSHSLLPFGSLKLKPHKLSLQAIFQRYGAPVLITSKTGYGPNLTRFPKFQVIKVEGHEADDVVATLAAQVLQRGYRVVIASPDKDFKQLISEDVQIVISLEDLDRWDVDVQLKEEWLVERETHYDSAILSNFFKLLEETPKLAHQTRSKFSDG